ncbi:hypothetical protein D187_001428 [Cystobacter fuscus DSM 2262]|uniref:Uncharacterized protein n=1 Tax=Cystobacter fuscus (strain ATCC 25194 / DSM 2262 / NBRC 100088 / M29) TaxID=1242864 RepID=S9QHM1_CYSF2|nr:hypothetical protein D187_001428 [Cystobacter fuscus DSM 2262]
MVRQQQRQHPAHEPPEQRRVPGGGRFTRARGGSRHDGARTVSTFGGLAGDVRQPSAAPRAHGPRQWPPGTPWSRPRSNEARPGVT